MDFFDNLAFGFTTALTPVNLALCFAGCFVGALIGVLAGVGPIATIAMLMPFTPRVDPTGALIMLAGIYYGAQYGGSTTSILVNIPASRAKSRAGRRSFRPPEWPRGNDPQVP